MHANKILVCDVGGQPHHWASWQDAVVLKYKGLLSYEQGDASVFHGGTSRMTGERSQIDVGPIVFLKESLSYDTRTPPLTNNNLFARDLHICGYCGRRYLDHKLSRDHIHPVSKGGKNTWTNCITACKGCNYEKADSLLEDTDLELLYVPYVPSHAERLILQHRNVLFDQMVYLKAFLPEHSRIKNAYSIMTGGHDHVEAADVIAAPEKQKRHFYSAKEISAIRHQQEVENSRRRRRT